MSIHTLAPAIEAILFSSNRPLRVRELQQVTDSDRTAIEQALDELRESLTHRGLMLQRHHDQVQLVTRPELAGYVRRALRPEVTGRLSAAAYETLAIVAYQQPVTRSKIEEIRGVNSDGVVANLELRDLVKEVGRGTVPGQPKLFGTTIRFLQMLGLESLDDLPFPDQQELELEPAEVDGAQAGPVQEASPAEADGAQAGPAHEASPAEADEAQAGPAQEASPAEADEAQAGPVQEASPAEADGAQAGPVQETSRAEEAASPSG